MYLGQHVGAGCPNIGGVEPLVVGSRAVQRMPNLCGPAVKGEGLERRWWVGLRAPSWPSEEAVRRLDCCEGC